MLRWWLGAVLVVCVSSPAARAQLRNSDAYLGYSRLGSDTFYPDVGGLNGWQATLHIHLAPFFGAEGDVAQYGLGAASSVPRTTTYMVGPRVTAKALGVAIWLHGLLGGEHSSNGNAQPTPISGNGLAWDVGGGVDFPIVPFFAWRVSADRISSPTISPGEGSKDRFGTGLVFRF